MGIEGPAERAIFTDPAGFGERCTYVLGATRKACLVDGVFSESPEIALAGGALEVQGRELTFTLSREALPAAAASDQGDELIHHATVFRVRLVEPDITGMVKLTLGEG